MKRLSSNLPLFIGAFFIIGLTSFLIYINVTQNSKYLLAPTLNIGGFGIFIIIILTRIKAVYFDKSALYYKTLLFFNQQEVPLVQIFNIVRVLPIFVLSRVYKIMFYDEEGVIKSVYFIKSFRYFFRDIYEVLDIPKKSF